MVTAQAHKLQPRLLRAMPPFTRLPDSGKPHMPPPPRRLHYLRMALPQGAEGWLSRTWLCPQGCGQLWQSGREAFQASRTQAAADTASERPSRTPCSCLPRHPPHRHAIVAFALSCCSAPRQARQGTSYSTSCGQPGRLSRARAKRSAWQCRWRCHLTAAFSWQGRCAAFGRLWPQLSLRPWCTPRRCAP